MNMVSTRFHSNQQSIENTVVVLVAEQGLNMVCACLKGVLNIRCAQVWADTRYISKQL